MSDDQTLQAYESQAGSFAERFKLHDRTYISERLPRVFKKGAQVLELGCGSGEDAATLLAKGIDIVASDASASLLQIASKRFPELSSRLVQIVLPQIPLSYGCFDGVFAIAVLQHLSLSSINLALRSIHRILRPGGIFLAKIFDTRPDLDSDQRDSKGRLMTLLPPEIFTPMLSSCGFRVVESTILNDVLDREGVVPREYVCERLK